MTECVNLLERFGKRYRVTFDPCYNAKGRHRDKLDPWMMQVTCRYGTIYPFGGTTLAVETEGHPLIKGKLARLDGCRLHQDGDDGFGCFLFDVADFNAVADIVQPYRRRQLSEEQRQALRDKMTAVRSHLKVAGKTPSAESA